MNPEEKAKLTRIFNLADVQGLVKLSCPNTGYQVEIEVGNDVLAVVVCKWDEGDEILFDGPTDCPLTSLLKVARKIKDLDVVIDKLEIC